MLRDRHNSILADADVAAPLQEPTEESRWKAQDALDVPVEIKGYSAADVAITTAFAAALPHPTADAEGREDVDAEKARTPTPAENIANYEERRLSSVYARKPKTVLETTRPTDVQATIIEQVRQQVPGAQERFSAGERQIVVNDPKILRFTISGENTVTVQIPRRKRMVEVTYNGGSDLYDVRIVDLARDGLSITGEKTVEGAYFDMLGDLIVSDRVRA